MSITTPRAVGLFIHSGMTRQIARRTLLDSGWTYLGGGSFSSVWRSPDGERAVKVTKPDRGSDATTAAAQDRRNNPHLPKVYGHTRLACGGSATEVEVLQEVSSEDYFRAREAFYRWQDGRELERVPAALLDAFWALTRHAEGLGLSSDPWDIHCGNMMSRNGETVVLTDLLYDKETLKGGNGHGGSRHDADSIRKELTDEAAGVTIERDPEPEVQWPVAAFPADALFAGAAL
jgi:hypothetical protein